MRWDETLAALYRRWYVVVIGVLFSAALAFGVLRFVPVSYSASGTVLLLPSKTQLTTDGSGNPLLVLGALSAPAGIVIERLDGADAHERVAVKFPGAEYTIVSDPTLRGPAVLVTTTAKSSGAALDALDYVLTDIPAELTQLQTELKVAPDAKFGSMQLASDKKATKDDSSQQRLLIAAPVAGLVVTLFGTVAIDAIARRSLRRRANRVRRRVIREASGGYTGGEELPDPLPASKPDAPASTSGGADDDDDEPIGPRRNRASLTAPR